MVRKKSFTLIELLVVIAIIAILAAMLLPALNSARDRSRSSACISNHKQMATAINQYSVDFDGIIIPALLKNGEHSEVWNWLSGLVKNDYISGEAIRCPNAKLRAQLAKKNYDQAKYSYEGTINKKSTVFIFTVSGMGISQMMGGMAWYNERGVYTKMNSGNLYPHMVKMSSVKNPGKKFLAGDSLYADPEKSYPYYVIGPKGTADDSWGKIDPRHDGLKKAVMIFADGHVETRSDVENFYVESEINGIKGLYADPAK